LAQAIVAVAGEAGLALPSDENFRAEEICAELPWRVVAVQFPASLAVATFAERLGGVRALARAVGEAEPTVRRWGALGSGELRPIGHLNGIVAKLAKFARAEIRKARRRVVTERGPAGDREIIAAYLRSDGISAPAILIVAVVIICISGCPIHRV